LKHELLYIKIQVKKMRLEMTFQSSSVCNVRW